MHQKPEVGASRAGSSRRCSIRVLSDGNSLVIGNGSSAAPKTPRPEATHAVPQLRKTKVFRLDQLPLIEKA